MTYALARFGYLYPLVQYQLLKTVDTLSKVPMIRTDPRFQEMLDRLKSKQDSEGRLLPESINKSWSDFDFGQKKSPSPWVTFLTVRAIMRANQQD